MTAIGVLLLFLLAALAIFIAARSLPPGPQEPICQPDDGCKTCSDYGVFQ